MFDEFIYDVQQVIGVNSRLNRYRWKCTINRTSPNTQNMYNNLYIDEPDARLEVCSELLWPYPSSLKAQIQIPDSQKKKIPDKLFEIYF